MTWSIFMQNSHSRLPSLTLHSPICCDRQMDLSKKTANGHWLAGLKLFRCPVKPRGPFLNVVKPNEKEKKEKKVAKSFLSRRKTCLFKWLPSLNHFHSTPDRLTQKQQQNSFSLSFFFRKQVAKMTFHLSCLRWCLIRAMSRPIMAPWLDDEAFWHQRLLRHCLGVRQVHVYTRIILGRRESVQCSHGKQFATLKFLNSLSGKASSEQRT